MNDSLAATKLIILLWFNQHSIEDIWRGTNEWEKHIIKFRTLVIYLKGEHQRWHCTDTAQKIHVGRAYFCCEAISISIVPTHTKIRCMGSFFLFLSFQIEFYFYTTKIYYSWQPQRHQSYVPKMENTQHAHSLLTHNENLSNFLLLLLLRLQYIINEPIYEIFVSFEIHNTYGMCTYFCF